MRKTGYNGRSDGGALRRRYLVDDAFSSGVVGGRSVLESASDPLGFAAEPAVEVCDIRKEGVNDNLRTKWKFSQVCPRVARGTDLPELGAAGDVLLLWGTGAFRQSDVCFAWAPLTVGRPVPLRTEWRYFSGFAGGRPQFIRGDMESAIGLLTWSDSSLQSNVTSYERTEYSYRRFGPPRRTPGRPDPPSVGEFSVAYIPSLGAWLMLITGHDTVLARLATGPWGPWGEPAVVLSDVAGFYAPFSIPTLTGWDAATHSVDLYFLGSFLQGADRNGRVYLYRAKLQLDTSLSRAVIPSGILAPLGRL